MTKGRLEAFSDGVIAIIITIMVLDLKAPASAELESLLPVIPTLLSYILSFVFIGIYWNNHHHLLQATQHVNGTVLWANLHLLFWLSLVPFVTSWLGVSHFATWPLATYGAVLLMAGTAYFILARALIRHHGRESTIAKAIGKDTKGALSVALYVLGILAAFIHPWLACGLYCLVAVIWLIPDRRIEQIIAGASSSNDQGDR
jgi:uncharacterized membrane protein